jgi:hypothetical protein
VVISRVFFFSSFLPMFGFFEIVYMREINQPITLENSNVIWELKQQKPTSIQLL